MITGLGFGLEDCWPWPWTRTCCPRTHPWQFGNELTGITVWYRIGHVLFSCRFMVPAFWHEFAAPISGRPTCVVGIMSSDGNLRHVQRALHIVEKPRNRLDTSVTHNVALSSTSAVRVHHSVPAAAARRSAKPIDCRRIICRHCGTWSRGATNFRRATGSVLCTLTFSVDWISWRQGVRQNRIQPTGLNCNTRAPRRDPNQSCPWAESTRGLDWVLYFWRLHNVQGILKIGVFRLIFRCISQTVQDTAIVTMEDHQLPTILLLDVSGWVGLGHSVNGLGRVGSPKMKPRTTLIPTGSPKCQQYITGTHVVIFLLYIRNLNVTVAFALIDHDFYRASA